MPGAGREGALLCQKEGEEAPFCARRGKRAPFCAGEGSALSCQEEEQPFVPGGEGGGSLLLPGEAGKDAPLC